MKKRLLLIVFLLLLCGVFPFSAGAEEEAEPDVPDGYGDFLSALPEDLTNALPPELFSEHAEEVGGAVKEMSGFSYLIRTVLTLVGADLGDCLSLLATVCGTILLSAVCRTFGKSLGQGSVAKAFSFCATTAMLLSVAVTGYRNMDAVAGFFDDLDRFASASIPVMGALYATGGNVSAAVATSSGLEIYLTVLEEYIGHSILPFCGICMGFGLINALNPSVRLGSLLGTVKKTYTTVLTFLMMLLLAMLGSQTLLGARSDSLAMKSAKFAAGNMIPVVGGSVSELLRTVSAEAGYLRGMFGVCGTLLLLLLLLPTLVRLLLCRLTWMVCASVADLCGCDAEKKLADEFASLNGYLIAAVCVSSSVLFLSFTILTHCASAFG